MADLYWYQYALIGMIFIWSGFVRSGLGFGGAVLALPFLLLIVDDALVFLPLIAVHLLVFSSWIAWCSYQEHRLAGHREENNIDWTYIGHAMKFIIVPKLIGVLGLLTLPPRVMSTMIFLIVIVYAIGYVLNRPFRSRSRAVDVILLMLGGYISGTSLIGAPLLVAVFAAHVAQHQLRDTLFALWFILVTIKMASFIVAGVDLQLIHHLWLLPCAWVGHVIGQRFHARIVRVETGQFFRIIGIALMLVSIVGILSPPA